MTIEKRIQILRGEIATLKDQLAACQAELADVKRALEETNKASSYWMEECNKEAANRGAAQAANAEMRRVLLKLDHCVHSNYDFNADPDKMTLLVCDALSADCFPASLTH